MNGINWRVWSSLTRPAPKTNHDARRAAFHTDPFNPMMRRDVPGGDGEAETETNGPKKFEEKRK